MNNNKILILEDEKIIAIDLQRKLERFGYFVVGMTEQAEQAIELAKELNPDLLLSDIMLQGDADGITAAQYCYENLDIPTVFLTAFSDSQTLERAKTAHPYGYILKPFKDKDILNTIEIAIYKHKIERELAKQQKLFSAILTSINDGIIATDTDFIIQFMNPIACDILETTEEKARGKHFSEFFNAMNADTQQDFFTLIKNSTETPIYLSEILYKIKSGAIIFLSCTVTRLEFTNKKLSGFVINLHDITEIKKLSERITYQSNHDILTGLSNRDEFSYKLNEYIKNVKKTNLSHALLMLDIDRFKVINDTCGAIAGDELLRQVASFLQAVIQRNDVCARMGGDEFAILLLNCTPRDAVSVANRIHELSRKQNFLWNNTVFPLSMSIGIATIDKDSGDVHYMLACADDALHLAKEEGGGKTILYNPHDEQFTRRRGEMEWISKLTAALEENRFRLFYQPIVPLNDHKKPKAEILIRMIDEDGSVISPIAFIPAAERYNLMPKIDTWVIENAFRIYRLLKDTNSSLANYMYSINLSGASVIYEELISTILFNTEKYGLSASNFCFEITETSAIQNISYASYFIQQLKNAGFTFALDDFGAGFSSFGYLRNLSIDYIKIDGSYIQTLESNSINATIVKSINEIAHSMGLETIAEFVKSESIRNIAAQLGIDYGQGYVFSEPKPLM